MSEEYNLLSFLNLVHVPSQAREIISKHMLKGCEYEPEYEPLLCK